MATEEIKLAKNVHSEAVSAHVSGMIQSGCCELQIKQTEAIFFHLFLIYKNTWMYPQIDYAVTSCI